MADIQWRGLNHPYLSMEYGHNISYLLQQANINYPDELVTQYPYIIHKIRNANGNTGYIHDSFILDIYQCSIIWIMDHAITNYDTYAGQEYTSLTTDEHFI